MNLNVSSHLASPLGQANAISEPRPSLVNDTARINDRLSDVLLRCRQIADSLHGAVPHPATDAKHLDVPMQTIRRNVDRSNELLNELDTVIARIIGGI